MLNLVGYDYIGYISGESNSVRGILLSVQYQHNGKFIKAKGVDKCKAKWPV